MEANSDSLRAEAIVKDLVDELSGRPWAERRDLVSRIITVEQVALSLLEGKSVENGCFVLSEQQDGIVGEVVAEALRRLGLEQAVCGDSAYVLSISADRGHRAEASVWYARHPQETERERATLH